MIAGMKAEYFLFTVIFTGMGFLFSLIIFLAFLAMEKKRAVGKQVLDEKAAIAEEAKLRWKLRKLATYQEKVLALKAQKNAAKAALNDDGEIDIPGLPVTPLSPRNSVWARKSQVKRGLVKEKKATNKLPVTTQPQSATSRQSNIDTTSTGPANALEEIECNLTNLLNCSSTQKWFMYSSPGRTVFWQIFGVR